MIRKCVDTLPFWIINEIIFTHNSSHSRKWVNLRMRRTSFQAIYIQIDLVIGLHDIVVVSVSFTQPNGDKMLDNWDTYPDPSRNHQKQSDYYCPLLLILYPGTWHVDQHVRNTVSHYFVWKCEMVWLINNTIYWKCTLNKFVYTLKFILIVTKGDIRCPSEAMHSTIATSIFSYYDCQKTPY